MKKSVIGIVVAVVAVAIIGGLVIHQQSVNDKSDQHHMTSGQESTPASNDQDQGSESAPLSGNVSLDIQNFAFSKPKLVVKQGTMITWTNKDSAHHTVTSDTGTQLASQLLGTNETYSMTFNQAGTFAYHCEPHPYMKATVEVVQ